MLIGSGAGLNDGSTSPFGQFNDMGTAHEAETFAALARGLAARRLAYLHVVNPAPEFGAELGSLLTQVRRDFAGTLILAGGFDRVRGEAALVSGAADLVAFGTPFLANPDFVRKLRDELPLRAHDPATLYTPGEHGYLDYAATTPVTPETSADHGQRAAQSARAYAA